MFFYSTEDFYGVRQKKMTLLTTTPAARQNKEPGGSCFSLAAHILETLEEKPCVVLFLMLKCGLSWKFLLGEYVESSLDCKVDGELEGGVVCVALSVL